MTGYGYGLKVNISVDMSDTYIRFLISNDIREKNSVFPSPQLM